MMAKQQIELNASNKLIHIVLKCIVKAIKYTQFNQNIKENISYIYEESYSIFSQFNLTFESPYIRTMKNLYF